VVPGRKGHRNGDHCGVSYLRSRTTVPSWNVHRAVALARQCLRGGGVDAAVGPLPRPGALRV